MKSIKVLTSVLAVCAGFLTLTGCDLNAATDAVDNLKLVIGLDSVETYVTGQVIDAATGELVEGTTTLTFSGPGKAALIDIFSDPIDEQEVNGGMTAFGIENATSPSASAPLHFVVKAVHPQYEVGAATVTLTSEGAHSFKIYLAPRGQSVPGSTQAGIDVQTNASGTTSNASTITTPNEPQSGTGASLNVPSGTTLLSASGSPVSGNVNGSMTYFSGASQRALGALPGGSNPLVSNGGQAQPTGFMVAGFANISMSGNNPVTDFNGNPVTATFEVPAGTPNPNTGQPIANNDVVDVYSFDENTGAWVKEGQVTFTGPNGSGNYTATFEVKHLSWWALAWTPAECSAGLTININRNGNNGPLPGYVEAFGFRLDFTVPPGVNGITLPGLVTGIPFKASLNGVVTNMATQCGGTLTIDLPTVTNPINAVLRFYPECSGDGVVAMTGIPTLSVLYRPSPYVPGQEFVSLGSPRWTFNAQTSALEVGEVTVYGVESGKTYTVSTTFSNQTYSKNVTVTGNLIEYHQEIDDDYCQ